jgi:hypothetical protein
LAPQPAHKAAKHGVANITDKMLFQVSSVRKNSRFAAGIAANRKAEPANIALFTGGKANSEIILRHDLSYFPGASGRRAMYRTNAVFRKSASL